MNNTTTEIRRDTITILCSNAGKTEAFLRGGPVLGDQSGIFMEVFTQDRDTILWAAIHG